MIKKYFLLNSIFSLIFKGSILNIWCLLSANKFNDYKSVVHNKRFENNFIFHLTKKKYIYIPINAPVIQVLIGIGSYIHT